ncbi:hypothetical protein [Salipiger sp. PrR003]|uniref:hypothetical protein n=1 Tax=Salipiger sp. PrR003 TaxID=2706776 RepID=UPI0013DCD687|nr:hypothetical protein [Salipiger sp. PrR003]NDV53407.1 hypothetical protein [Salipiger sp. PrR003]
MPHYVKGTNILIKGTAEVIEACYPIVKGDQGKIGWGYAVGGNRELYDDDAKHLTRKREKLFFDEDGEKHPESNIEWREDDIDDEEDEL